MGVYTALVVDPQFIQQTSVGDQGAARTPGRLMDSRVLSSAAGVTHPWSGLPISKAVETSAMAIILEQARAISLASFSPSNMRGTADAVGAFGLDPSESSYRIVASGTHWCLRDYGGEQASPSLLVARFNQFERIE